MNRRFAVHCTAAVIGAMVAMCPAMTVARAGSSQTRTGEVRGLWVGRTALVSPASIATMVRDAEATGINTLFVQVRGRGEAFYRGTIEPRAADLASQSASFDPLAETLARAHAAGLRVHAWVNVNLVSSAATLPQASRHVVRRHPEWLMVPRSLAASLAKRSPRSTAYLSALAAWTVATSARVEGLYLSPLVPAAQDHTVAVIKELARAYPLDGIHLDYIRFPGSDFDYSPAALAAFRQTTAARSAPPADRGRLDRAARADPTIWTRTYAAAWTTFREERLTALVSRLRAVALEARPGLVISAAVVPDADMARTDKMQRWTHWADVGYLDAVCPMIYTTEAGQFEQQLAAVRGRLTKSTPIWAGIGAYRLTSARTAANVRAARHGGAAGVMLFSYENLAAEPDASLPRVRDVLRTALLEAPSAESP